MASCHTHATLCQSSHRIRRTHRNLGGAAVPSCTNQAIVHRPSTRAPTLIIPQNSQNPQKRLRGKYSPTDFTDFHRLGGYGILPYPRHPLPILPQNSPNPQKRLSEISSHRFHRCPQIFRLRFCLLICAYLCNLWEFS